LISPGQQAIAIYASQFPDDPAAYARHVLRVSLTPDQRACCRDLICHKKLLVKASHDVGKTFLGAVLVNWFYDSFQPGITLTTAPTDRQVRDLLWKEVRILRGARKGFRGAKMPRLEDAPDHWACGFTARDADSFQGHHSRNILKIFDEATGVDQQFWEAGNSMRGSERDYWFCIFNPTSVASQPYIEERRSGSGWKTRRISALSHPNVVIPEAPPIPGAVTIEKVRRWIQEWGCELIDQPDLEIDFEFPKDSGQWYRPGPVAESRLLGRYPRSATDTVWSDALVERIRLPQELNDSWRVYIGCDVAHYGDDFTAIHVRQGSCSLHHESHNGWGEPRTAQRLKELCRQFGEGNDVEVRIDVTGGFGQSVVDLADGYNFLGLNSSNTSPDERFRNVRSLLWFGAMECAREGLVDISRLAEGTQDSLTQQLLAPVYQVRPITGHTEVEPKQDTKKRFGRSPDDADAFNLAYLTTGQRGDWGS